VERGPGEWTLFLRGDNLLDEEIRNATSLLREMAPEAGISVEAGVRLEF
jgi:iron complex outermembrane receptor protein